MSTEATRLKARWQHFAGRLGNWLGIGKERFMEHARERLADILTACSTVRLGSKMWLPKPELKQPLENEAYLQVQERFGTNGKFIDAFINFFEGESISEIECALTKLRRFFACAAERGHDPRRLIPLLYAMMKESSFSHFLGNVKKYYSVLEDLSAKIADGSDPIREYDFDQYVKMLIEKEIKRLSLFESGDNL